MTSAADDFFMFGNSFSVLDLSFEQKNLPQIAPYTNEPRQIHLLGIGQHNLLLRKVKYLAGIRNVRLAILLETLLRRAKRREQSLF